MPRGIHGSRDIRDETIEGVDIKNGTIEFVDLSSDINWKESVANEAALPTTNNSVGDARIALSELSLNLWDGTAWQTFTTSSYSTTTFNTDFAAKTTDDLTEGSTNKYFYTHTHNPFPVGSVYVQYATSASDTLTTALPTSQSPASLFGGTWVKIWDTEGIDFHTEGYNGAGRTNGLMEDQLQGHDWYLFSNSANTNSGMTANETPNYSGYIGGSYYAYTMASATTAAANFGKTNGGITTDGISGTPRTGTRTSDRNRLMRVWRRSA